MAGSPRRVAGVPARLDAALRSDLQPRRWRADRRRAEALESDRADRRRAEALDPTKSTRSRSRLRKLIPPASSPGRSCHARCRRSDRCPVRHRLRLAASARAWDCRDAERLLAIYYIPGMGHGGPEFDCLIGAQLDALEAWIDFRQSSGQRGSQPPAALGGFPRLSRPLTALAEVGLASRGLLLQPPRPIAAMMAGWRAFRGAALYEAPQMKRIGKWLLGLLVVLAVAAGLFVGYFFVRYPDVPAAEDVRWRQRPSVWRAASTWSSTWSAAWSAMPTATSRSTRDRWSTAPRARAASASASAPSRSSSTPGISPRAASATGPTAS